MSLKDAFKEWLRGLDRNEFNDEIKTGSMKTQIRTHKTADILKILNDENNKNIYQSNLHFDSKPNP